MAIQYLGTTISGLASDTKPALTTNEKGVLFVETDTGKVFEFQGDNTTDWVEVLSVISDASTSAKGIASFSSDNFAASSGAITIKDSGVANAELVNSTITLAAEAGSNDAVALGETFTFTAGEGINTTMGTNAVTIAGEEASTSNKGVASFSSDNFAVSSGVVTIKDAGVILGTETTGNYVATVAGASNEIEVSSSTGTVTIGIPDNPTLPGNVTIGGNLTVSGTTITVNSSTMAVVDPIINLQTASGGGAIASDTNKDVGLALHYHTGSAAKTAFLGFDDSDSKLMYVPDATISSEVVSGSVGTIKANLEGNADSATLASTVTVVDSTDTTSFIAMFDSATGSLAAKTDAGITYNAGTGMLTATGFAGTIQTATQANITSLGTLTSIELGHATDTTLVRASAGDVNIEGNIIYRAGGTDVPVTDGGTGVSTLTDGGVLLGSGTSAITAMTRLADGEMIVGQSSGDPVIESGATLRTSIGVGTGDAVQFAGITGTTGTFTGAVTFDTDVTFDGDTTGQDLMWDADSSGGSLIFDDNVKAKFGDSGDLEIYHNGNDSYISAVEDGRDLYIQTTVDRAVHFRQNSGERITLNVDDTITLTGDVAITGALALNGDSLTSDGDLTINASGSVFIGDHLKPSADDTYDLGDATYAWRTLHLEGDVYFMDAGTIHTGTGTLTIDGDDGIILQTTGSGGVTIPTDDLSVGGTVDISGASAPILKITNTDTSVDDSQVAGSLQWYWSDSSTSSTGLGAEIRAVADQTYSGNQRNTRLEFRTTTTLSTNTYMTINSGGYIGINTASSTSQQVGISRSFGDIGAVRSDGIYVTVDATQQGADADGYLHGVNSIVSVDTANTHAWNRSPVSIAAYKGQVITETVSTVGLITGIAGIEITDPSIHASGSTITNLYGMYIAEQTESGSKVTNAYGLYIKGADTYALFVDAGTSRFDGHIYQPADNVKHYWGANNDLEMYHDGSTSYIANQVGELHLYQNANSNIKFSTNGSNVRLSIEGDGDFMFQNNNFYDVGHGDNYWTDTAFYTTGTITATGNITAYSDVRLKENIKPIDSALNKVERMKGVTFDRIDTGESGVGVLAQDLEEVAPELVYTPENANEYKSVAYGNLTAYLVEAIKELKKEIEELKNGSNG